MRLTKLKLAGFKSFVDPTSVLLPGQLVAVVGPNGCGKSNIIDAVRWVLGETKAAALRGASMQDVIFNGSSQRKPVGRASVELIFDNSLGKAVGQWTQYAEISVKRVLERNGDSSYHINGTQVRRRDVIDLFLGTGLGPRAYAIIEQGMISRIIEAKPEDLRLFLEEAAGVTKYKERRRETQNRLEDTRENLLRVDDIRNELGGQIGRLEAQAEVASRFAGLNAELAERQDLLWLLKRNEARGQRERALRDIEASDLRLEAETAQLRQFERELEAARQSHYATNDALHLEQSQMYGANAEVARLEADLARQRDSRAKLEARLARLAQDAGQWRERQDAALHDEERWRGLLAHARDRLAKAEARQALCVQRLPEAEGFLQAAEAAASEVRRELSQAEQQLRVEQAHRASAMRALEGLEQRQQRLDDERERLQAPDRSRLEQLQGSDEAAGEALALRQQELAAQQERLPELQTRSRLSIDGERAAQRRLTEVRARRDALLQLQHKVQQGGEIGQWMRAQGLDDAGPLWRALSVEDGWEMALEAVLRERLSSVHADTARAAAVLRGSAPATVVIALGQAAPVATCAQRMVMDVGLAEKLRCEDASWRELIAAWLEGVFVADDLVALLPRRGELARGECWVNRAGQVLDRDSLTLYSPDDRTHGVLERQREIDALEAEHERLQLELDAAREAMAVAESLNLQVQEGMASLRREIQELQGRRHGIQVELLKLNQAHSRYLERCEQIERDLSEVLQAREFEHDHQARAEAEIERAEALTQVLRQRLDSAMDSRGMADSALREARAAESNAAREVQEARFSERECGTKLEDVARARELAGREIARIAGEQATTDDERRGIDELTAEAALQQALGARAAQEDRLVAAREALETAATQLRGLEEARLKTEQALAPLRERLGELRLKEQAAQLSEEQFAARLAEGQRDEQALAAKLTRELRESGLNADISRLGKQIVELGAVNLAALDELRAARERKGFLDAQTADLTEAIATLEDAIRRIDRETRQQLQHTYDTVNNSFGRLFPELFGGGEARLVLTGDEILDAGIQVMAHPPGKKNASIHLLSGGEKALTAIALVFAMFQLNPAPFCLLDEVDAPLDDSNTERFCEMVKRMSQNTQFLYISHNKITMEMAQQLIGVTMQEQGVSRVVDVDIEEALRLRDDVAA